LASASSQVKCVTIEGNKHLAKLADSHLKYLGILNTTIVSENIDDCLSQVLQKFDTLDLVFFDANHRSTPLINYFNQCVSKINKNSIFVVDDVYWSDDMHYGWNLIKKHPAVSSSICTQRFGLLFFNNDLAKNHFHMIF
jgi:predicted O-methyltransferase YrrM